MALAFDEVWHLFQSLKGRRLLTLDRQRPFTVEDIASVSLTVRVEETGLPRVIQRVDFEEAWHRLLEVGRLARTEIQREISLFNPAYVATLLAQVTGVSYTLRPIVLTLETTSAPRSAPGAVTPPVPREFAQATEDEEPPENEEAKESVADRLAEHGNVS